MPTYQMPTICLLPTTDHALTTCVLLPAPSTYLLLVTYCLLAATYHLLPAALDRPPITYHILLTTYAWLIPPTCFRPPTTHCLLPPAYCLAHQPTSYPTLRIASFDRHLARHDKRYGEEACVVSHRSLASCSHAPREQGGSQAHTQRVMERAGLRVCRVM